MKHMNCHFFLSSDLCSSNLCLSEIDVFAKHLNLFNFFNFTSNRRFSNLISVYLNVVKNVM